MIIHSRKEFESLHSHFDKKLPKYCENCYVTEDLVIHHIVPLVHGGRNVLSNLVRLCSTCHDKVHGYNIERKALQKAGIEKARKRGAYENNGAKKAFSPDGTEKEKYFAIVEDLKQNRPIAHISKDRKVSRPTIYKIKDDLQAIEG